MVATYNPQNRTWSSPERPVEGDSQDLERRVRKLEHEKAELVHLLELKEEKLKQLEPLTEYLT